MQYNTLPWIPYLQNAGVPNEMYPVMNMPLQELENMYPKIYYSLYPMVSNQCNNMDNSYGNSYIPGKDELNNMIENIMNQMDSENMQENPKSKSISVQQWDRNAVRDLAAILLVRELIDRRGRYGYYPPYPTRPYPGYGPGRAPGFGPPYGRGPGYYYD